jgi:hypothetical protein
MGVSPTHFVYVLSGSHAAADWHRSAHHTRSHLHSFRDLKNLLERYSVLARCIESDPDANARLVVPGTAYRIPLTKNGVNVCSFSRRTSASGRLAPSRRSHHRQWNLTSGLCLALDAFPRAGCATNRRPSQRAERHSRGARRTARKAALLFLCVNTWEVRSLLSLKRATQCLNVTCPYAARHWGFNRYWRAFGVDFGKLVDRGRGYVSLRIHRYVSRKS